MMDTPRLRMESVPRSIAFLAVAVLLLTLVPLARPAHAEPGTIVTSSGDGLVPSIRFAGYNRYDTSQLIATDDTAFAPNFETGVVILATGERFPDALAGSTLGGLEDAPIVLTPRFLESDGGLNEDTAEALDEIDPDTVYILGEEEAISDEVADEVATTYGVTPVRIGGIDRYETAALIADETEITAAESSTAIVARGGDFPDALVAGAIAAAGELPLLLTPEDGPLNSFMEDRLDSLDIDEVLLAGGVEALSQEVEDAIEAKGIVVNRVFGANRYDTAVAFAEQAVEFAELGSDRFGFGDEHVNLARGDDFPDALTLGPHAGLDYTGPSPILLTAPDALPAPTRDFLTQNASCDFDSIHVAGGVLAISQAVEDDARAASTASGDACDVTLTPASATNEVGETHTVTATVTDNGGGVPAESVTVTFEAAPASETSTADPTVETATVMTDESGTATFSFTSFTPGDVEITATVTDSDGVEHTGTATKTFEAPALIAPLGDESTALGLTSAGGVARLVVETFDPVLDPGVAPPTTVFDSQYVILDEAGAPLPGTLVGLDSVNPLYALGDDGTLYTLEVTETTTVVPGIAETFTGFATATPVGTGDFGDAALGIVEGSGVGFDFNVSADAFRVVNQQGRNFTLDDESATATRRTDLAYADGDVNETATAGASAAAYTVNDVLYVIDTENEVLAIQGPPNAGTLRTVADLVVLDADGAEVTDRDISGVNGFDVDRDTNQAYVALTLVDPLGVEAEVTGIYRLDLGTGELTPVSTGDTTFNGLTFGDLPRATTP